MRGTPLRPSANVLGVEVDAMDMKQALSHVAQVLQELRKGYVCAANVHGVMESRRQPELAAAYAASEMTVPDGMPLVWVGHRQGRSAMEQVPGPALMLEIFRRREFEHVTHFFYGGAPGVAEELRSTFQLRFPWTQIVGTYAAPFRDLSRAEEDDFLETINTLKPDIIWVGIGCPKQEIFMARYLPLLETRLMFGVGAAFDFHTGRIRDSADWVKRAGLQWLHRLIQDPRRLWRRYLFNNSMFLWHIAWQLTGVRQYPRPEPELSAEAGQHAEASS